MLKNNKYIYIKYKEKKQANYFLDHPYIYDDLTEGDKSAFHKEEHWSANITHNLGNMADHIPVKLNQYTIIVNIHSKPLFRRFEAF